MQFILRILNLSLIKISIDQLTKSFDIHKNRIECTVKSIDKYFKKISSKIFSMFQFSLK